MNALLRRFPTRINGNAAQPRFLAFWDITAFVAVLVVPCRWWLGQPIWTLTAVLQTQAWVWGATFLLFALILAITARRAGGLGIATAVLIGAACWGAGYLFLAFQADAGYSRTVALLSAGLGFPLAIVPFYLRRRQVASTGLLAVATIAAGSISPRSVLRANTAAAPETRTLSTALHTLSITTFHNVVSEMELEGGAIEPLGDGYLLVKANGTFYRLWWAPGDTILRSRAIPLVAPLDRAAYLKEQQGKPRIMRLRVTDFVLDTTAKPTRVYVAHQHWNSPGKCFTMRVSVAPLPESAHVAEAATAWKTIFESEPCLSILEPFDDIETGGRLHWYDDGRRSLLLTVGDHGFIGMFGEQSMPQDPRNSYGKIVQLDLAGGHKMFSIGHRNPQGLEIDREGRIWSTEHGPQGGDEINIVEKGKNYGFPLVTYGTQYGLHVWPLGAGGRDHGQFAEPAYAFVPSIGISNLIQIGGAQFPRWDGDFLVASLRQSTLYRMRTRDRHVIYLEPILIGRRIRDLAEGRDGRVLLWTGQRDVVVLSRGILSEGQIAYGSCSSCHGAGLQGTAQGPSLRHVYDRLVATIPGFSYSSALKEIKGKWDDERLDAFLHDPYAFAPGTSMRFPGIPNAATRRALITFLHKNF